MAATGLGLVACGAGLVGRSFTRPFFLTAVPACSTHSRMNQQIAIANFWWPAS